MHTHHHLQQQYQTTRVAENGLGISSNSLRAGLVGGGGGREGKHTLGRGGRGGCLRRGGVTVGTGSAGNGGGGGGISPVCFPAGRGNERRGRGAGADREDGHVEAETVRGREGWRQ